MAHTLLRSPLLRVLGTCIGVVLLLHGVDAHRAAAVALLVDLQPLPVALCGAALWLTGRTRSQRDESRRDEGAAVAPAAA
jgi:drug/metabolite transporter (DMT)-like permease